MALRLKSVRPRLTHSSKIMEVLLIRRAPGHTPALEVEEARALLDAIDISGQAGLRDRALIGLMVYSFARVGAALARVRI